MRNKTNLLIQIITNARKSIISSSLFGGDAGFILIFNYLIGFENLEKHQLKISSILDDIFEEISTQQNIQNSFCNGLAGLGWVVEDLVDNSLLDADTNEILSEVDESVYEWMIYNQNIGYFDYLHGAIGGGIYFLKRMKSKPELKNHIMELLNILNLQSTIEGEYVFWKELKNDELKIKEDRINLGLSHGLPSILVFLVKCSENRILTENVNDLIDKLTNFILSTMGKENSEYSFPSIVYLDGKREESQNLGWCYGDLGVCCALWQANKILKRKSLEDIIMAVLKRAASKKNSPNNLILDANFCHGTVGIAHIFLRFYERYHCPEFLNASNYWYEETIKMAYHKDGLAGFKTFININNGEFANKFGLLNGIDGIAASLSYKLKGQDPKWDEIFLIS